MLTNVNNQEKTFSDFFTRGKRSFYYRTVRMWNELNEEVVGAISVNDFKKKYDEFIKNKNFRE